VRVVRAPDGALHVASSSRGRGAWLCSAPGTCLQRARARGAFSRAFRTEIAAGEIDRLADELTAIR
jgi:predicted RNA-binding protein YlxR (DUF448 family)